MTSDTSIITVVASHPPQPIVSPRMQRTLGPRRPKDSKQANFPLASARPANPRATVCEGRPRHPCRCLSHLHLSLIQSLIFSPSRNLMILDLFHHYLSLHPLNLLLFSPACFGWKFSFFIVAELLDFRIIL